MSNQYLLALQGSYKTSQVSLYKNTKYTQRSKIHSVKASSALIPLIETLLWKEKINISKLDFIAIDQGPGAFTSLRVTVVTANALSFASNIKLIGINGLKALALDMLIKRASLIKKESVEIICILLNAYNNDVYSFAIHANSFRRVISEPKCLKTTDFLNMLKQQHSKKNILFTGNGSELHRKLIENEFGKRAVFENVIMSHCSADAIAKLAFEHIVAEKETVKKLMPIYMKTGMNTPQPKKMH